MGTCAGARGWRCALVLLWAAGHGCAHDAAPATQTPERALAAFALALEQGQLDRAYTLMSEGYRARVSLPEFRRQLEQYPRETLELGSALAKVRQPAQQEALLRYGAGETVRLHLEHGQWSIGEDSIAFYDQSTPRAALLSFVRAIRAKRYDVVLRFIPLREREGVTPDGLERSWSELPRPDLERVLANLQAHLDAPIEIAGEHATMPYAERLRAQLLREDGVWKIEALE